MTIKDYAPKTKDKVFDRDEWQTPPELFERLNERFRFTVDACASKKNALLPRYWTKKDSALLNRWMGERVFCNPPYSDIGSFVRRAFFSRELNFSVLLIPSWTDRKWWHEFIEPIRVPRTSSCYVEFLPGRIKFLKNGKPSDSAPFPSCLIIFGKE